MPEFLEKYLRSLNDEQANQAWLWFDGGDMWEAVEVICESHPAIVVVNKVKEASL